MTFPHEIWVFAERESGGFADVGLELLAEARELRRRRGDGARVAAVVLGGTLGRAEAALLAAAGAEAVYHADSPRLAAWDPAGHADALVALVRKHGPEVLLAGATPLGRAFLPRVAALLGTGLTADCTSLEFREREGAVLLHQTRPAFGGNLFATIVTASHRPQMATVRPHVFRRREFPAGDVEVVRECADLPEPAIRIVEAAKGPQTDDIASSRVLVAGGRGLGSEENFRLLGRLAALLGGQVAASRGAVDLGWAEGFRQVGQTGATVAPRLYLAFGISGAIQHLVGIRGAGKVIAVNRDPSAPIFAAADFGIVGDAVEVLKALIGGLAHD